MTYYYHVNFGHCLRRWIHLCTAIVPIFYYWLVIPLATKWHFSSKAIIGIIIFIILILEITRLSRGILIPGQRDYEKKQISGFTWGSIGIATVCLFAPEYGNYHAAFGLPLIWAWVFGDPALGEARRRLTHPLVICTGVITISAVWLIAVLWLGTPLWIIPLIVPVTVLAELIKIRYVDDNFTMLVFPLILIMIIYF